MRERLQSIRIAMILAMICATSVSLMGQVLKGSISGTVEGPNANVLAGADVEAKNIDTGVTFTTVSNSSGVFRLSSLPAGSYDVKITAKGSGSVKVQDPVKVTAGTDTGLGNLRLHGSADIVPAEASAVIGSAEAQRAEVFNGTEIETFPGIQENQGLDRMTLFIPGIVNDRSNNFSVINGTSFSTNGLRSRYNNQEIDGQDNNDNLVGGPVLAVRDPNFVEQYVATTNQIGPEYGRNGGSVINVITKSGTDMLHGSLYGDENGRFWNAFSNGQKLNLPTDRQRLNNEFSGFTIGGPLVKNRLFIFGGFDNQIINTSSVYSSFGLTPTPAGLATLTGCFPSGVQAAQVNILKTYGPYAFTAGNPTPTNVVTPTSGGNLITGCPGVQYGRVTRTLSTPNHAFNGVFKADIQLGSDTITSRYIFNRNTSFNNFDNGPAGYVYNITGLSQGVLESWTHNFSAHMVNEARFSYSRENFDDGGNDIGNRFEPKKEDLLNALTNVQFNTSLTLGFGTGTIFPQGRIQNTWQGQDNWNYVLGRHQFKSGVNWTHQSTPTVFLPLVNGQYRFVSTNAFINNTPSAINIVNGDPKPSFSENDLFLYFGDDWKITQNLTLNLGLTWSYFSQPVNLFHDKDTERESNASSAFWNPLVPLSVRTSASVPNFLNGFGPGVGFAYSPQWGGFLTGNGKTVIRGGYRMMYDPGFNNIYTNIAFSPPQELQTTFAGASASTKPLPAVPTGANVRAALAPFISLGTQDPRFFSQTLTAPDFRPDRVQNYSLGFERELTKNSAFEARYVGVHGTGLVQTVNANPFIRDLTNDFPNLVPAGLTPCSIGSADVPTAIGRPNCHEGIVRERINGGFSGYNGLQLEFRANNLFKQLTMRTGYTWSKTLDNTSEIFSTSSAGNTNAFSQNPSEPGRAEKGISGLNFPSVWTLSFNEQLPFLTDQKGVAGHLLGGWGMAGNYIWASGQPYTPTQIGEAYLTDEFSATPRNYYDISYIGSFTGTDTARPFVGNPKAPVDSVGIFAGDACFIFGVGCAAPATQLISENAINGPTPTVVVPVTKNDVRFITNAHNAHALFGTPFGDVGRNTLTDAPTNVFNFSVYKNTKLTERMSFEIHATALNAFNHFNFAGIDPFLFDAGRNSFGTGFANPKLQNAAGRVFWLGAKLNF